jgi:hypothetical protein
MLIRTRHDLVTARVAAHNQLRAHLLSAFPGAVGLFHRLDVRAATLLAEIGDARGVSPKGTGLDTSCGRRHDRQRGERRHPRR